MVDGSSLENILASLQSSPWSGKVYRVMLNDYPPDRENTQGARWNPPDVAAIYTCLEPSPLSGNQILNFLIHVFWERLSRNCFAQKLDNRSIDLLGLFLSYGVTCAVD
jgi:hypothetical protein